MVGDAVTSAPAQRPGQSPEILDLVGRACAGERAAFDRLQGIYATAVTGFVRVRLANEADAQDVVQDTWLQVWQKLATYDPARASFITFVKYWASVLLLRAYNRRDLRRGVEVLVNDLIARSPDIAEAEGVGDILERLAGPAESHTESSQLAEVYAELLYATFTGPSPPHQLIAFGFIKCLGWTPRRVASELSDALLEQSEQQLERSYLDHSLLADQEVRPAFDPLRRRLRLRVGEAVTDLKTQATYRALLEHVVGETRLRDYYTGDDAPTDLTQWWYAVHRRVRGEVHRRTAGPLFQLASARAARKADSASTVEKGSINAGG